MSTDKVEDAINADSFSRRKFIKITGITALGSPYAGLAGYKAGGVSIIIDPADKSAGEGPVTWAIAQLDASLTSKSIAVKKYERFSDAPAADLCILVATSSHEMAKIAGSKIPAVSEALGLIRGKTGTTYRRRKEARVRAFVPSPCKPGRTLPIDSNGASGNELSAKYTRSIHHRPIPD